MEGEVPCGQKVKKEASIWLIPVLLRYTNTIYGQCSLRGMVRLSDGASAGLRRLGRAGGRLGCGTGTMTELLSARGYDMIGVDISEDMLSMAMEKRDRSGSDILYLCQDMRELELYGTVRPW